MSVRKGYLLSIGGIAVGLAGLVLGWHAVASLRAMEDLRASMDDLSSDLRPSLSGLEATDVDSFLAGLRQTLSVMERIQQMESRRQESVSSATWLQRALADPIDDTWKDPLLADLDTAYRKLPALFARQTRGLAEEIEKSVRRGAPSSEVIELAAQYRARRDALRAAARDMEHAGRQLLGSGIGISSAVAADSRAQKMEDWIERSSAAEKKALQEIQRAVTLAASAAAEAGLLDPDAASADIKPVLDSWQRASEIAHLALDKFEEPPPDLASLVHALLEPVESRVEDAVSKIDSSLERVDEEYKEALLEESSGWDKFVRASGRFVREIVGRPKGLVTTTEEQFQRLASGFAAVADQGLSAAISSARTTPW
jgi:hypothetical protein